MPGRIVLEASLDYDIATPTDLTAVFPLPSVSSYFRVKFPRGRAGWTTRREEVSTVTDLAG